jgi:predicted secreted protein
MALSRGFACKAYYGAAGVTATNEMTNVRDVKINLEKGEADVTTRGANGWRQFIGTLKAGSVEFEMLWNSADSGFAAIQSAYFNDTAIALKFLDEYSEGLDGDFEIMNLSRDESLEEAVKASVTAKLTYSTRAPAWL